MGNFVHLHLHTEYSLLDGALRIDDIGPACEKYGMQAVAMTDHGNMYGACTFFDAINDYNKKHKTNIKPIFGCEFYVCDNIAVKNGYSKNSHLILLAKDETGYLNLSKLNAIAFRDGYYYKPRIDYNALSQHAEGLICTSACVAGDIPQYLLKNMDDEAEKLALRLKNMFAPGDFYLEVQDHGLIDEKIVLPKLFALAEKIGVKTVATNDVHYLNKEDAEVQDIMLCVQMHKNVDDPDRFRMGTDELYFKSYEEMLDLFPDHPEALEATVEIAEKCNYKFTYGHYKFPRYIPENGQEPIDFLRSLIDEGIKKKYKVETKEIRDRVEYELSIISRLGFVEYYLIVWDYINAAKRMGISVGPGRGSGAGSVVAYVIDITDIDPLKYELYFERFLNPERVSAPDFDVDFEYSRRAEVIDYVKRKYGDDRVIKIITFGTMAAKNAIKDVGRVLNVPYSETDKITKAIPDSIKRPFILKKVFGFMKQKEDGKEYDVSVPDLVNMYNSDETIKQMVDIAIKLEDMPRQSGIHACGVIIGADALDNFDPLSRNEEFITTQYTGPQMEHLGHLKMDFLGLVNLSDIRLCIKYVKENYNVDINFSEMNTDDQNVYKMISTGNTKAVFQIESPGFQKFLKELQPNCLEDIIAGVSLYRPGPMDSIPKFVDNKFHPEKITYDAPCLEPILNYTYGCIVYQEQVMKIVQEMAGYSLGQADNVRRMMGKKKVADMEREKPVFIYGKPSEDGKPAIDGCVKRGISVEVAEKIWGEMANFAKYAFNKSHAAAYSLITYQTAYLKCYYETEFLCAVLNNRIDKSDEIKNYINYAKSEGIKILPPDINKSQTFFTAKDKHIRFGLAAIRGVGVTLIDKIIAEREKNGEFTSLEDFCNRVEYAALNKRVFEGLIYSGAFDCFGLKRSQMNETYPFIIERIAADKKKREEGQCSLFDIMTADDKAVFEVKYPNIREFSTELKLKYEKDVTGIYISGHPLDDYADKFKDFSFNSSMFEVTNNGDDSTTDDFDFKTALEENGIKDGAMVTCGGIITEVKKLFTKGSNKEMGFFTIEDLYGSFELVVFPKVWDNIKQQIFVDNTVTVAGKISLNGNKPAIIVDNVSTWTKRNQPQEEKKIITLYLKFNVQDEIILKKISTICSRFWGQSEAIFVDENTSKAFKFNQKVNVTPYLLNELYGAVGFENVKIIEK